MGVGASEASRDALALASWNIPHGSLSSPWTQYVLRRYGAGIAATGVSASIAVPGLLRLRLQDWAVSGLAVRLGPDFVAFGRALGSVSQSEASMFYGVDIHFGEHARSSWLWFCKSAQWLLVLHQAVLEEAPGPAVGDVALWDEGISGVSSSGLADVGGPSGRRWPGRPRYLYEDETPSAPIASAGEPRRAAAGDGVGHSGVAAVQHRGEEWSEASASVRVAAGPDAPGAAAVAKLGTGPVSAAAVAAGAGVDARGAIREAAPPPPPPTTGMVSADVSERRPLQLSILLSNADGHIGLLSLPVPEEQAEAAAQACERWSRSCAVPLRWAGRQWSTNEDFQELRSSTLNMPDLLLLGLETNLAMVLTPDGTWEKYPLGLGEVAFADPHLSEDDEDGGDGEHDHDEGAEHRGGGGGGGTQIETVGSCEEGGGGIESSDREPP